MNRIIQTAVHGAIRRDLFERKEGGGGGGGNANTADRMNEAREIKNLAEANAAFQQLNRDLTAFIQRAQGEVTETGRVSKETQQAVEKLVTQGTETKARIDAIEAKFNRDTEEQANQILLPGELFTKSDAYKALSNASVKKATMQVKDLRRYMPGGMDTKAILNATGLNQPLVPAQQIPGVVAPINRRMTIRDLLPVGRTTSNSLQYVRETLFTNNAGPQVGGSPTAPLEGALKNESDIQFDLQTAYVATLAHYIMASRQVLDDAPMLESYINQRLIYGLALEEEDELLNGDGSAGQLNGLFNQAIAYNRGQPGDTPIDTLLRAQTQVLLSEYDTEFYVLHPTDWERIILTKDTQGRYIIARPEQLTAPILWSKPVVATQAITAGYWLAGNGSMAAQIWDRQDASVELSREDRDNFIRNLVTILCEERLALTVYRPQALVKGQF